MSGLTPPDSSTIRSARRTRGRAALAVITAVAALAVSCGGAPAPPEAPDPRPPEAYGPAPLLHPARYLLPDQTVIEHTADGLDHVVMTSRRLALRGAEIAEVAPADVEVDGGARAPAWSAGTAARYVFWKGKQLWGAETFMGPLHALPPLPEEPREAFAWLDGEGVAVQGGALVEPASGAAARRLGVTAPTLALAVDARRAVAVTALGHAFLTLDGGASYRDVSADLPGAVELEPSGDGILARLIDGRERRVAADGAIGDARPGDVWRARRRAPDDATPDAFEDLTGSRPLDLAVRAGLPLGDGGVVIAMRGFVGRFDLATRRSTSVAALDPGLRDAECTPVRAGATAVLACVGPERAAVVDLEGAPRTERTFDLAGAPDLSRFVAGGDGALGFLGPCDGSVPRMVEPEIGPGGEPVVPSRQRTPAFCVRVASGGARDAWVEHRLDPLEASDLVAWIPRPDGGAVALVARAALFLEERERVSVRGALRVVRLARSEPPLSLSPFTYNRSENVETQLRALADDSVVGWLSSNGNAANLLSVTIDPGGHVHGHAAPPRAQQLVTAGPLGLIGTEDGHLFETVDSGQHWADVEPPPTGVHGGTAQPSACSTTGCYVGGFARLGWSGPGAAAPPPPPADRSPRERYRRPPPPPPLVRLVCAPAGPPEGRRIADSGGFGYTPQAQPRSGVLSRLGSLGVANIPWANGMQLPPGGDIDLAWLTPLDLSAAVHRLTVPISHLGLGPNSGRPYELRVDYLLEPDGSLQVFTVGQRESCWSNLLEAAGIVRPLGACAEDGATGVDLGDRIVVVHGGYQGLDVSTAEAPPPPAAPPSTGAGAAGSARAGGSGARARRPAAFTIPVALHDVHRTPTSAGGRGFHFGTGVRAGAPVVVVVDVGGDASLSPVDPALGTIGAEERLRPLTDLALGSSPACAPRAGEAQVVLPFEGTLGVDRTRLRGVGPGFGSGVAVIRWSRERACLDAVELSIRDDRFDESPGQYEPHGTLRKIIARFTGKGPTGAMLALIGPGTEVRQRLACTGLSSAREDLP